MEKQCSNAKKVIEFLKSCNKVKEIYYPGLGEEKYIKIFKDEYSDSGSMISFEIDGTKEDAFKFLNNVKVFKLAVSLGAIESLIQHPASMTHSDISKEEQLKMYMKVYYVVVLV